MKFEIFKLSILCLTAIFIVYLYTQNTGDNACYKKAKDIIKDDYAAYYDCYLD